MNTLKKSLLVLAGAATLAVSGVTSAMSRPYAMCTFKGETAISAGGITFTCWVTLTTKIDCTGNLEIVAVGLVPDGTNPDPNCYAFATADLPWVTTAADIIAGGSIDTDAPGFGLPSMVNAVSGVPLAAGTLSGVGPAGGSTAVVCDSSGSTINVPTIIPVNGTFSTGLTFVTNGWDNKGCFLVP